MSGIALASGALVGFLGAIPPGPASMALCGHAAEGRTRAALSVGLGAATVDVMLCAAIGLGAGPWLARMTEPPAIRVFLAAAYAAMGTLLLAEALLRRAPRATRKTAESGRGGYLAGVLRGVLNPSVVANWTLVITALSAARIFPTGPVSGCAFAVGVGIGVLGWFATLTRAVSRAPGARIAPWLRAAAVVTGALLVVGGCVGAIRALAGSRADSHESTTSLATPSG